MADIRERVIVLANRAPLRHQWSRGRVTATRSASGLVTALEPLLEAYSGTWVAHAAGSADMSVIDALGGMDVPPANPQYRFLAIERLLEMQPELIGRFAFVQVAEPSRDCLAAYRAARTQALDTCQRKIIAATTGRDGLSTYIPITGPRW